MYYSEKKNCNKGTLNYVKYVFFITACFYANQIKYVNQKRRDGFEVSFQFGVIFIFLCAFLPWSCHNALRPRAVY